MKLYVDACTLRGLAVEAQPVTAGQLLYVDGAMLWMQFGESHHASSFSSVAVLGFGGVVISAPNL
jgi:hypothetical protein